MYYCTVVICNQGCWRTRIEWVPGHSGIDGNDRSDQLAGGAALEERRGRTSIAWLKGQISKHFAMAKDTKIDKGKESIAPPALKKSLDRALNRLARTIAQIWTGHWLYAPYVKRIRKHREEQVSDKCWRCGQYRMSRTNAFLRCMHPNLEDARKDIWDRPNKDGRKGERLTSLG
jgi:hypothetical protein